MPSCVRVRCVYVQTFRAGEKIETAALDKSVHQYTYQDGESFVFMNMETYEEIRLPEDPAWSKYLLEGMNVELLQYKVGSIFLPIVPLLPRSLPRSRMRIIQCNKTEIVWGVMCHRACIAHGSIPHVASRRAQGKVIDVGLPNTVTLEVLETDPGIKGNTAQGGSKPATMNSGAIVQVPLFVNIGDKVDIDTRTNEYLGRSNS